jgi:ribosomal 30S subunit maturation factor RimM
VKDEQDLYLPFTLEHVPQVDLETGQIVVRPPEG